MELKVSYDTKHESDRDTNDDTVGTRPKRRRLCAKSEEETKHVVGTVKRDADFKVKEVVKLHVTSVLGEDVDPNDASYSYNPPTCNPVCGAFEPNGKSSIDLPPM